LKVTFDHWTGKWALKVEKFCFALIVYCSLKEHNIFQVHKELTVPPSYSF